MNMETKNEKSERSIITQISMAIIVNLSSIAAGISIGFSAIAIPSLMKASSLNLSEISWIASIIFLTNPIGCCMSGWVADNFGRKGALIANDFISFSGWTLIIVAYYAPEHLYPLLLIGRLITGISSGMVVMTPSVYIAEMSSANLRSMFTTWNSIFISFGILLCYLLGLYFQGNWGAIALLTATFPVISTILILIFLPESYVWLISQSKMERARNSIKIIFGNAGSLVIEEEINSLLEEKNKIAFEISKKPLYRQFLKRTFVIPMMILTSYFFFLNFSGVFMIIAYGLDFVSNMKITINPYLTICLIAGTRLFGAMVLGYISKFFGRRPLSIVSGMGMTACMLGLGVYLLLVTKYHKLDSNYSSWIPILLIIICYFMGTIGFISIPYAMAAEMFPLDIRGIATGLAACVGYFLTFLAVKMYPSLVQAFHDNYHLILLLYGIVTLIGTIFIYFFLPETKGKSLKEIEESFKNKTSAVI